MRLADVMARVETADPALASRVETAARLSELMARNQLPQVTPAAFVLPLGLRGGRADAATGLFRQSLEELIGVVLVLRAAGDATGMAGLDTLDPLITKVINVIVGWGPGAAIGVFRLSRGELVSLSAGTLIYQLDFALDDQLRIST